jgi:hypothetical protein
MSGIKPILFIELSFDSAETLLHRGAAGLPN